MQLTLPLTRTIKTKLNITSSKVLSSLKKMAGCYRFAYNLSLEIASYGMEYVPGRDQVLLTYEQLYGLVYDKIRNYDPCFKEIDCGILKAAIYTAQRSYEKHFVKNIVPDYMSRKYHQLKFKTTSKLKVFHDYITIPKLGKVKLFEKGYIPQGKTYRDVTFSFDGKDWWLSLAIEEPVKQMEDNGIHIYFDFAKDGTLVVNGSKKYENVIYTERYQKQLRRYKKLLRRQHRQIKANIEYKGLRKFTRKSLRLRKTQRALTAVSNRMSNIKKDYFRKVAHELARIKPSYAHVLSQFRLKTLKNNYLTRLYRESSTREFFNILKKKMRSFGCHVQMNLSPQLAVS